MTIKSCERCGKTFNSYLYETMCYKCQKEKNLEDVKKSIVSGEKTSTYGEDDVICPWCGESIEADCESSEFYEDGDHVLQCPYCDKEFTLSTSVSYTYSTERELPRWVIRDRKQARQEIQEEV
jgi:hypothetical protein